MKNVHFTNTDYGDVIKELLPSVPINQEVKAIRYLPLPEKEETVNIYTIELFPTLNEEHSKFLTPDVVKRWYLKNEIQDYG